MGIRTYFRIGLIIQAFLMVLVPTIAMGATTFFREDFEGAFSDGAPSGWTKSYKTGAVDWQRRSGDFDFWSSGAHGGNYNAVLYYGDWLSDHETYLVSPAISFGPETTSAILEFWHKQATGLGGHQDSLQVYYKTGESGRWQFLASYASNTEDWTRHRIVLPNLSPTYYIGFLGNAKYGMGVCIDDVRVYEGGDDGGGGSDVSINCYAVVCGVSDYQSDEVKDLNYCDDGARDVRDALLGLRNWKSANIKMLVDSAATKGAIRTAIENMRDKATENDICLFYFSGHGTTGGDSSGDESDGEDEYLVTYDDYISDDELGDWIEELPTDKYVVLLDTCYSGGQIKGLNAAKGIIAVKGIGSVAPMKGDGFVADFAAIGAGRKSGVTTGMQTKDLDDNGRGVVVAACDDDESSWESSGLENGVFTYYLVEGMAGAADSDGDGSISAEECYAYVKPRAAAYTSELPSQQNAQMYDGFSGELELAISNPIITKCTVKAGSNGAADSISVQGEINARVSDFNGVTSVAVTIDSNIMDPCVLTFPVAGNTFKNGKFSYSGTDANGVKKSFKCDTNTRKFTFSASKINLSGLECPLTISVEVGDYNATMTAGETIVNGTKPIPINLLMGVTDSIRVDKIAVKKGLTSQLSVKGGFSVDEDIPNVNMADANFAVTLDEQTWTIPAGSFAAKKDKWSCKKALVTEGGTADAVFDFKKCTFTLTIKSPSITAGTGKVNFDIRFTGFDKSIEVDLL